MAELNATAVSVPAELLDAIKSLPLYRDVTHCGETVRVGPFDLYATCPACGQRVKVRAFSASPDVEDVFDAVFGWMAAGGDGIARRRVEAIREDLDE
ncbi:MAG: hypothetical protein U0746_05265 [Gemmataceae bacterium]